MDIKKQSSAQPEVSPPDLTSTLKSATPLSALQLNNFKLDIKHTVLTPEYLENIDKQG